MSKRVYYDWPPLEGLIPFVREHGTRRAASRLGVTQSALQAHLSRNGVNAAEYTAKKQMQEDALKEIHDLLS